MSIICNIDTCDLLFDSSNGDHLPDVLVLLDQELQLWASQGKRCNKES